ncbi:CPBP family intramembrane glutamic endopeptidase [Pseudoxanthomonas putridarboris]|uniref:CPBP family intramembrane glutamic endopeptidase n=1 Tax=Pseudoxanthomonas putridarboris TaxID=752605 RepID=A0ABU9IX07_9GAMM
MSEPASSSVPSAPRADGMRIVVPPPLPLRGPLLAFGLDALLALVMMFALMMACYFGWALWRGVRLAMQHDGALAPDALAAQLGAPGALVLIVMTLISMGCTSLLLYVWRRRATPAERAHSFAAARRFRTWAWVLAAGVATFLLSSLLTWCGRRLGLEPNPSNLALIEAGFAQYPVFLSLFVVVLAPLYEEVLFRRVLFGRLWAAGWPVLGVALSSAVFALMHEIPGLTGNPPLTTVFLLAVYVAMGAVFAVVYRHTGTLWAPIGAHMLNNALALGMLQASGG